jgi:subtilase family serine protease
MEFVAPSLRLQVQLVFKIRNATQFQKCLNSINDPSSPEYGRYLNSTTLQPFLPTPGQKASVSDLLTRHGLIVTDGASPLVLNAKGNASAIMSAFAIRLAVYNYRNAAFFATDSDPQMPSNLASLVNGILGLENYTRVRPAESPCSGPYCPQGIQIGYSISTLISSGETGSGQKVAVVDLPGDPSSQIAIDTFDAQYGLPATTLDIVYPDGTPTSWDPGWASEAAMDIEAVHSVAPGATIVLAYDLCSLTICDPMNGVDYVAWNGLASVISNSWGYSCFTGACSDTQLPSSLVSSVDSRLAIDVALGVTILFASGDEGAKPDGTTFGTEFPASDPNVVAVGATNLVLNGCGATTCTGYGSESGATISGGGYSGYFSEPSWQTPTIGSTSAQCTTGHLNPTCRAVPDVAMLGYIPGFWVYSTVSGGACNTSKVGAWYRCAGTSLSTPLWAGFIAVALQVGGGGQFGNIAPLLYPLGAGTSYSTLFHDVTSGSNGYSAGTGWDAVTGWGSPIANNLASALSQAFDFRLSNSGSTLNLGGISVVQGSSGPITITISLVNGPTQTVSLSCSGAAGALPTGVSCSFNPASGSPSFTSTLTVFTTLSTPTGYYTIKVTGTAGALSRSTLFVLNVT